MESRCFLWVSLVSKLCVVRCALCIVHCALCLWSVASSIAIWNCSVRFRFISFYFYLFFVFVLFAILLCTHLSYIRALCMILILILYPFYDTSHFQSKHKIRVCLWVCMHIYNHPHSRPRPREIILIPCANLHRIIGITIILVPFEYANQFEFARFILFCFCWFQKCVFLLHSF